MRQDPEENDNSAYTFFVDKILGCVVGRQQAWNQTKKCFNKVSSPIANITPSDEAFALLVMINNWEVVFSNRTTPRFTSKLDDGVSNRRNSGWSKMGIQKFNELAQKVKANRKEDYAEQAEQDIMLRLR